ncbi:unnamed protein product [Kuraishia capsulata CBS 1993]|uniref:Translation machinery-associated protein 22 n=1 Tax=Kuraishia capsulata CBS 1993 TaxID=1382522 RepID=W6MFK0_9ASCO|nr:uncharacterized protein KUCA_T00000337001 [Kuraishia capsulata CBS 1993]CDK24376.1 unnamed protein product [Kuraishia capsulata CBS 1993]
MSELQAVEVKYCEVCTFPLEYCEFGASLPRCKDWLKEHDEDLYNEIYNSETKIVSANEAKISKDLAKLQLKEAKKHERELEIKKTSKITLKIFERTKRKRGVAIQGLEVFGADIDIKKMAKQFASKFATGASVVKDEIVVQGDVADEIEQHLLKLLKEKGLDEVSVEQVDEKRKKPADPKPDGKADK